MSIHVLIIIQELVMVRDRLLVLSDNQFSHEDVCSTIERVWSDGSRLCFFFFHTIMFFVCFLSLYFMYDIYNNNNINNNNKG